MVSYGIYYAAALLAGAAVITWLLSWPFAIPFYLLAAFCLNFFRDPDREIPAGPYAVSPADGKVMGVRDDSTGGKRISIFLNVFDVHVNRTPIGGKVTKINYIYGQKIPATSNKASLVNERNELMIEGEKIAVTCTQIAGIVARRVVCWSKEGDNLERGQLFGLIKFSSRTDLQMPANVDVLVKIDDKVKGGETIIARII